MSGLGFPRIGTRHVGMCLRCHGPLLQQAERYGCDLRNGGARFVPDRHEFCVARSFGNAEDAADINAEWAAMTLEVKRQLILEHETAEIERRKAIIQGTWVDPLDELWAQRELADLVDP